MKDEQMAYCEFSQTGPHWMMIHPLETQHKMMEVLQSDNTHIWVVELLKKENSTICC